MLQDSHKFNSKGVLMVQSGEDGDQDRIVLVSKQEFCYDNRECYMMNLRDLTQHYKLQRVMQEKKNISLLNSTVTHEMMTPLNCVTTFSERLVS